MLLPDKFKELHINVWLTSRSQISSSISTVYLVLWILTLIYWHVITEDPANTESPKKGSLLHSLHFSDSGLKISFYTSSAVFSQAPELATKVHLKGTAFIMHSFPTQVTQGSNRVHAEV